MSTLNGLPAHLLLVHAVLVLVPLSAALLLLTVMWPAARPRLSLFAAGSSAITLALIPFTVDAGRWLARHLMDTPLMRAHAQLADNMLPWALGLFASSALIATREFIRARGGPSAPVLGGRTGTIVLAVLSLSVAVGSAVTIYRIGESGTAAVWTGKFSPAGVSMPAPPAPKGD